MVLWFLTGDPAIGMEVFPRPRIIIFDRQIVQSLAAQLIYTLGVIFRATIHHVAQEDRMLFQGAQKLFGMASWHRVLRWLVRPGAEPALVGAGHHPGRSHGLCAERDVWSSEGEHRGSCGSQSYPENDHCNDAISSSKGFSKHGTGHNQCSSANQPHLVKGIEYQCWAAQC